MCKKFYKNQKFCKRKVTNFGDSCRTNRHKSMVIMSTGTVTSVSRAKCVPITKSMPRQHAINDANVTPNSCSREESYYCIWCKLYET